MAATTPTIDAASGVLTVDLAAIAENWRSLSRRAQGAETGAVVKANAYGLGLAEAAPALWAAGARRFYVAEIDEAVALRALLPQAEIVIFAPTLPEGLDAAFGATAAVALNNPEALAAWRAAPKRPRAVLHIDTGLTRLGFDDGTMADVWAGLEAAEQAAIEEATSHLACADTPEHPMNQAQLARFRAATAVLPQTMRLSLANSSGVFLGGGFLQTAVRPGMALYGLNPTPGRPNPMRAVVRLDVRILQVRKLSRTESIGYGATASAPKGAVIATIGAGYADGLHRALSNVGHVFIAGERAPIIGRVSMDLIAIDVSHIPEQRLNDATHAQVIGDRLSADALAKAADTIGYEILTSLGRRYARVYEGGA